MPPDLVPALHMSFAARMQTLVGAHPMRLLMLGKVGRVCKSLTTVWTFVWFLVGVHRRHVRFVLSGCLERLLAFCASVWCFASMYSSVLL